MRHEAMPMPKVGAYEALHPHPQWRSLRDDGQTRRVGSAASLPDQARIVPFMPFG